MENIVKHKIFYDFRRRDNNNRDNSKNTLFEILSLKYISYFLVFKKCFVFKPNNMLNKVML